MPLKFHPKLGSVVVCNYDTGFTPPEMVKRRLAVVVSARLPHRNNLCTVVPLSQTIPRHEVKYQCKIELPAEPPAPYEGRFKWAKADMLATVGLARLDFPYTPRDPVSGKRKYLEMILPDQELERIRLAICHALSLHNLTSS